MEDFGGRIPWFSGKWRGYRSSLTEYKGGGSYGKLTANQLLKRGREILSILQSLTDGIRYITS